MKGRTSFPTTMKRVEDRDEVRLRVYVQPRARENAIVGIERDTVKVRITNLPVGGAANRGLRKFLAKTLGIPPSRIEILSGLTSRHKTVRIIGLTLEELRVRLGLILNSDS
jgi:hypothetical protein